MKAARFFQNEKGDWKIFQPPNLLLSLWFLVQVINFAAFRSAQQVLATLAGMLLFAWAYDEMRRGESPFRKVLGGVVLLAILINLFIRWQ